MTGEEIRKILAVCRTQDVSDAAFVEALKAAEADPLLAIWLREEQEFDRRVARNLFSSPVPPGLKTEIVARHESALSRRLLRSRRVAWLMAIIAVLLALFSSWRGVFHPAVSLGDFRSEMISFISVPPSLELETSRTERIQDWLASKGAPSSVSIPPGLKALQALGCRVLVFRGSKITLICFRRDGTRLAHLFVVDRDVLSGLPAKEHPLFASEAGWMTAAWQEEDRDYLLAAQGDRKRLEHFLFPGTSD